MRLFIVTDGADHSLGLGKLVGRSFSFTAERNHIGGDSIKVGWGDEEVGITHQEEEAHRSQGHTSHCLLLYIGTYIKKNNWSNFNFFLILVQPTSFGLRSDGR